MIGRLPGNPPRSPREVPKLTPGAPKNPQSTQRALQNPQDVLGVMKPMENQQQIKENHIKRIRTIENQTEYKEAFTNISDDRKINTPMKICQKSDKIQTSEINSRVTSSSILVAFTMMKSIPRSFATVESKFTSWFLLPFLKRSSSY